MKLSRNLYLKILIAPYVLRPTISNTSYREMLLVCRFSGPTLWHPAWMLLLMLPSWQTHITSHQKVMEMTDLALKKLYTAQS